MKHLVPATFTLDPDDARAIICPVSKKRITSQQCILIKATGHVVIQSVFDEVNSKTSDDDLVCPVTGERIEKEDILKLARSGSSFAATGNVTASKWRPGIG